MEESVLSALLERNKTDRRLFLAQSDDPSRLQTSDKTALSLGGRPRLPRRHFEQPAGSSIRQEPRSHNSRQTESQTRDARAHQQVRSDLSGPRAGESNWRPPPSAESGSWRRKGAGHSSHGAGQMQWRRGEKEREPARQAEGSLSKSNSNWRDKRQTAHNLAKQAESNRQVQAAKPLNGYGADTYYQGYDDQSYTRDYTQDYLDDGDMHYGSTRGLENLSIRDDRYDSYHEESPRTMEPKMKRNSKDTSLPGPGYVCRICGQPGGKT